MPTISYEYIGTAPTVDGTFTENTIFAANSLFSLDRGFVNKLNTIPGTTLGQAQPYISISVLGAAGQVIDNLNLSFFHKPLDLSTIAAGGRFSDRPGMSLQSIDLTTDNASGYLYYTQVNLVIKIHNPKLVTSCSLVSLMFPGMPLLLEYGWSIALFDGDIYKEKLLVNVVSYDLSFDTTNQATLSVKCMAFNDDMANCLVGDYGEMTGPVLLGLAQKRNKLEQCGQYIQGVAVNQQAQNNVFLKQINAEETHNKAKIALDTFARRNFFNALKSPTLLQSIEPFSFQGKKGTVKCIKFHNIIKELLEQTLLKISEKAAAGKDVKVIYGTFNDKAGLWAEKSIADFPVEKERIFKDLKNHTTKQGAGSITVKEVIEDLSSIVEDKEYYKQRIQPGTPPEPENGFKDPDIKYILSNNGDVLYLHIFDAKAGLPATVNPLATDRESSATSESEEQNRILQNRSDIPIIITGNACSFIKSINLTQIQDESMKAVFIKRSYNNARSLNTPTQDQTETTPTLRLPLQGSADVIGHVRWKPQRAFYLSTGIFLVDGVYAITKVSHKLDHSGFKTRIEFMCV